MTKVDQIHHQQRVKDSFLKNELAKEEVYHSICIITYFKEVRGEKRPCLVTFRGTAAKPLENFYYRNEEDRALALTRIKTDEDSRNRYKMEKVEKRRSFEHSLKVGSILISSWGYEQTNVDFYQVIEVKGKSVIIREIAQERKESENMSGTTMPKIGEFVGEEIKKLVCAGNLLKFNSVRWASPWDGSSAYFSYYY